MGGEKARAKTSMPWRERGIRGAPLFASAFARAARTSSGDGSCDSDVSRDIPSPVEARVARRDAPEPDAKLPGLLVQKSGQVGDVVTVDSYFVFYPRMSKSSMDISPLTPNMKSEMHTGSQCSLSVSGQSASGFDT